MKEECRYWLVKSEAEVFSIEDLASSPRRTTCWDGVRNYQARNFMRSMKVGTWSSFITATGIRLRWLGSPKSSGRPIPI